MLDFIAEQQRYCQERESSDKQPTRHAAASTTPELPHPNLLAGTGDGLKRQDKEASSSLLQLRHLIPDAQDDDTDEDHDGDDEDDDLGRIHHGFSTTWMPVRSKAEHIDLNNLEVIVHSIHPLCDANFIDINLTSIFDTYRWTGARGNAG